VTLYRVFPFDANARPSEPGGATFVPRSSGNRISNPELHDEMYLSNTPAAALGEAFGRFDTWTEAIFTQMGKSFALATFEMPDGAAICDLDDAGRLLAYELSPSEVVARDRSVTKIWAARIYQSKKWLGIAWWSRYNSRWRSVGLWSRRQLRLRGGPEVLSTEHSAVQEAAALLPRRLEII
jgi:RES domain